MIRSNWAVAVVVPAHDEAEHVESCVRSVLAAHMPRGCTRSVVLVADRCRDDTAVRARRVLGGAGMVVEVDLGCVGAARRIGTGIALARGAAQGHRPERTWVLSTDADSTVDPDWVQTHLSPADAGAIAVAGTVVVASFDEHPEHVPVRFARRYGVSADGTHGHVHGTNLGVRADRYLHAGGWHDLATAEDHDLWDRLGALGGPLVSTSAAPVLTSGRAVGRAPEGFASLLQALGRESMPITLPATEAARDQPAGDEPMGIPA